MWRGGASILMRATLNSLGADDRTVWVALVRRLPDPRRESPGHRGVVALGFLAVPVEQVKANFARLGFEDGVKSSPASSRRPCRP
jgi:Macrocin-O-methyltransferase (TylF)